jgi:hypothetical protein
MAKGKSRCAPSACGFFACCFFDRAETFGPMTLSGVGFEWSADLTSFAKRHWAAYSLN